jgi:hypothetical protein
MSDDPDAPRARPRISKTAQPTKEQILKLDELSRRDYFPALARLVMVPENRSRKAYTVVREIYLSLCDSWWHNLVDSVELHLPKEDLSKLVAEAAATQKKMLEVEMWLKKPTSPLSMSAGLKMVEGSDSPIWRNTILKQIGKRSRRGQPASKRYLALGALDLKCAYPHSSLQEITKLICPCGKQKHPPQCREQQRQQIKRLVKFLREHGHDFKWEHISTWTWEPPE